MINNLRKSGIDIIGEISWGTHICQFYQTKEDLMDILVPYFKAGLENNEFCLWVTSQPLEVKDVIQGMSEVVPDFINYLEKWQIEIISYKDWFLTDGDFDCTSILNAWAEKLTYASKNGYEGFRLSGNTSWLDEENWENFIAYKERSDNIIGNYQMIALCTYSLERDSTYEVIQLVLNHQYTLIKHEKKWELVCSLKRKVAEETAYKALKDWKHTFDAVPDLISIIDTNFKIIRANRTMASKLGRTPEDCIGLTCYSVVHETSKPPSFCPHRQTIKDGLEHTSEVCEDCLGGYFVVSTSPIYDSEGKLTGSIHVARDINERKQMEEALRESEIHFRTLAVNSPDIISRFDRQLRHIYVNQAAVLSYGIPFEKIIGRTNGELGRTTKRGISWENHLESIFATGKTKTIEYSIELEGKKYYFNTKLVPEFVDDIVISVLAISRDITDIKEIEENLKLTLENSENLVKERTAELKKAYDSLKESERGLSEAQQMAHIGNWEWDIATDKAYWSEELYHIFMRSPQELAPSYNEYLSYVHPDDRDYVKSVFKKATVDGMNYGIDHRIILENGEVRTVHINSKVIFDHKNAPIRIKGTVQDITERIKTAEKIRSLANVVESTKDAVVTISLEGYITSWNKGAEQIYGYSANEIIGKPTDFVAPSHLCDDTKKLVERVAQGESVNNYETLRVRKDGKLINVSLTLSPVYDFRGNITAASGISRDITEKKLAEERLRESEEKYRNIVETANEGIVIIDEQFKTKYVNQKMADMLGYSPEECVSKPIWDFISGESIDIVNNSFNKKAQGLNESYEFKLRRKDGSSLWVFSTAKSLSDINGRFMGSLFMLTDITQKKEAELELSNIEIARKKEIHHRIKNNLQVISSLLDLQADKFRNKKNIKDTEVLTAFRESQDRVISMALIHEELHRGGGFEKLNFSLYVEELSNNLLKTYSLGTKNISLKLSLDNNVFFNMDDAIPLGMIINELVSNSFKHAFMHRDKGEIQIKLQKEKMGSNFKITSENSTFSTFILIISDNGVGIPANLDIEALDSLGLQLVSSLVSQLGGELKIKRNRGIEYIIRFNVIDKNNRVTQPLNSMINYPGKLQQSSNSNIINKK